MFRFTIRDVLWLTVVVGLAVTLCISSQQNRRQSARLKKEIELWEWRADSLRNDVQAGRRYGKIDFTPGGMTYGHGESPGLPPVQLPATLISGNMPRKRLGKSAV